MPSFLNSAKLGTDCARSLSCPLRLAELGVDTLAAEREADVVMVREVFLFCCSFVFCVLLETSSSSSLWNELIGCCQDIT